MLTQRGDAVKIVEHTKQFSEERFVKRMRDAVAQLG